MMSFREANQIITHNDSKVYTGYAPFGNQHIVYMECNGRFREVPFPTQGEAMTFFKKINVYRKLRVSIRA